jgi:hypothetical protein
MAGTGGNSAGVYTGSGGAALAPFAATSSGLTWQQIERITVASSALWSIAITGSALWTITITTTEAPLYVGEVQNFDFLTYNPAGALANPTGFVVRTGRVGGTVTTYTYGVDAALTRPATGTFRLALSFSESGPHYVQPRSLGSGTIEKIGEIQIDVHPTRI